jgi:hypothetical protein
MHIRTLALLTLVLVALLPPASLGAQQRDEALCFPDVPGVVDCIDPLFRSYWERNGALQVFGYPTGPAMPEEMAEGLRIMQHFERNRLERHPEAPEPYGVQLGRLGADRLVQLGRTSAPVTADPNPRCRFFATTGHSVCGAIRTYWEEHGLDLGDAGTTERESTALFGLPLTEAAVETNGSGDEVLTQWFERARLEVHPANGGPAILQGRLGVETEAGRTPVPPGPGFVTVVDDRLQQGGLPVVLKGLNYYPSAKPWGYMWLQWDGPLVERELARARRELGVNTVRALVPYRRVEGWTDGVGNVNPSMLGRLREFVQIAGRQDIKVIMTLFDWQDGVSPPGSAEEGYELSYLRTIVDAFKNDDRVMMWDIHNEPDHYPAWGAGEATAVVGWLGRMADAIRTIDSEHPLTVGVGKWQSLWHPGPDGRTIADISDVISIHSYDAAVFPTMVADVKARTTKPVLLEEFGWPTGPECRGPYFDESSQVYMYRKALQLAEEGTLVGMLAWWYQDPPVHLSYSYDENGWYGLYRRDGSPKPAVGPFRVMRVPALPSLTDTELALTAVPTRAVQPKKEPLYFDNGMVVLDSFKHFWRFFGGEATFGVPITLAYRDKTGMLVQYFEHARFELNESVHVQPIDVDWPEGQTPEVYLDRVHLTPLGEQVLVGHSIERVPDPNAPGIRYFPDTGHTLRGDFRTFWEAHGEIFYGPPLTEEYEETANGRTVSVQYFRYWRFEQEGNGPVRLAALGTAALENRQCP